MALTDLKCKRSKCPSNKACIYIPHKHGLTFRITKTQQKSWIFRIQFSKQRTNITIGSYPSLSIGDAEKLAIKYKDMASKGIDPVQAHKNVKDQNLMSSLNTFDSLYNSLKDEMVSLHSLGKKGWSEGHTRTVGYAWDKLKTIHDVSIDQIQKRRVRDILVRVSKENGQASMLKCKNLLSSIYNYAIVNDIVDVNLISAFSKDPVLKKPKAEDVEKQPSIPDEYLGEVFTHIDQSEMNIVTKYALFILQYTGLRVDSLLTRKWAHYDKARKRIFFEKEALKNPRATYCPTSSHIDTMLDTLMKLQKAINPNWSKECFIFSKDGSKRILKDAPNNALKKLLLKHKLPHAVPHGFRTTCEDEWIDNEFIDSAINIQMNHTSTTGNSVRDRYISKDKDHFAKRTEMVAHMQKLITKKMKAYKETLKTIKGMKHGRVKTAN